MSDHVHYLPDDRETGRWGLRLTGGGDTTVEPGESYPAPGHPESHLFNWDRGRVLGEFQVILMAAGRGIYEDRQHTRTVVAGQGILLVPGVWHRYRPDPATGWREQWLAFDGPAVRLLHAQGRLDHGGEFWSRALDPDLRRRLEEILGLLTHRPATWRAEAEALTASLLPRIDASRAEEDDPLHGAARQLAGELHRAIDDIARDAGLSPSQFRLRFRRIHGCSPRRYRQEALAAQARRLLANPGTTVAEVAAALGFSTHAHFTRGFRRAVGESPRAWRKRRD